MTYTPNIALDELIRMMKSTVQNVCTIAGEIGVKGGYEAGKLDAEIGGMTLQESPRFVNIYMYIY